MTCCLHLTAHTRTGACLYAPTFPATFEEPLASWESRLLNGDTMATVTFHTTDGRQVKFENVNPDSIGPAAANPGVIAVEFDKYEKNLEIVHVPFVAWWEISYSF